MNHKNIKHAILFLCLLITTDTECKRHSVKNTKYNVLFIFVDELRYIPNKTFYLPNIQKMVEKGIDFKHAYAQQALCAPSRNSIFTGRRPDSLRLYDSNSFRRKATTNFTTLPQLFKEHGYNTYAVGKVFHTDRSYNNNDDYPYSWSEPPYHAPSNKYEDTAVCEIPKSKNLQKNLICPVVVAKQHNQTLPDIEILNTAIKILKESYNGMKPFFLAVGFHKPHIPLKFPRKYLDKVPISKIRPLVSPYVPTKMPLVAWHPWTDIRNRDDIKRLNLLFPMGTIPEKWALKIKQSYFAAALYIDELIGILVTSVNRNNTITVLTSDHGWSLGENGLWSKYSNFDVALRVPLIFNIPKMKPKSIDTPVELIDLFPTLTKLVGLEKNIAKCKQHDISKKCFEGKSLVPIMDKQFHKKKYTGQPFAFSQYPRPNVKPWENTCIPSPKHIKIMGYTVRTHRYRYTEWVSFNNTSFQRDWSIIYGNELYDHMIDSSESNNVYGDDDYKKLAKRLSNLLRSHVERGIYSFNNL